MPGFRDDGVRPHVALQIGAALGLFLALVSSRTLVSTVLDPSGDILKIATWTDLGSPLDVHCKGRLVCLLRFH